MKLYDGYTRVDLTEGMRNKDKPKGEDNKGWYAGCQLEAMKYYCPEKFHILKFEEYGAYQGDMLGIAVWDENGPDKRYVLWIDSFGSCSFCDPLEGSDNGYDYIEDVLRSNTWQFLSLKQIKEYLTTDFKVQHEYMWHDMENTQSFNMILDYLDNEGRMSKQMTIEKTLALGRTLEKFCTVIQEIDDLQKWLVSQDAYIEHTHKFLDTIKDTLEYESKEVVKVMTKDFND